MSELNNVDSADCPVVLPCPVQSTIKTPLNDEPAEPCVIPGGVYRLLKFQLY